MLELILKPECETGVRIMYTLLIVDDEWQTRKGLRELVDWQEMGIEVVGDACNGQEALNQLEILKPDILLTDVRMPHMDGIELARQARDLLPQIAIVFISVYSDAEYLRNALRLEAVDYLYKPIHMEELKKAMSSLVGRLDQSTQDRAQQEQIRRLLETSRPLLIERFLRSWFSGILDDEQAIRAKLELLGLHFPSGGIVGVVFQPLFPVLPDDGTVESCQILLEDVLHRELQETLLCAEDSGAVGVMAVESRQALERTEQMLHAAADTVRAELHMDLMIGLSLWHADWLGAQQAVREARRIVGMQAFTSDKSVFRYESDARQEESSLRLLDGELLEQLLLTGGADALIARMEETLASQSGNVQALRQLLMDIALRADLVLKKHGVNTLDSLSFCRHAAGYMPILAVRRTLEAKLREAAAQLDSRQKKGISPVTDRVMSLIRTHYSEPLSIGEIAEEVHYSPAHLGTLFKKETGTTMSSYLLQTRLNAAMTLLRTTLEPVSSIAKQVGYPDTQYFSRVFKQFAGCTPLEYRRKAPSC